MSVFLLILGIILFIGLVLVHEWGHFIAARKGGVEVEEFGLGFPPRAKILTRKKGTIYSLNWLPLGGFVRLMGENDSDRRPGSFGAAPLKRKILIMVAGVGMNLLVAFLIFTGLSWVGMPKLIPNQFSVASDSREIRHDVFAGYVDSESPAAAAGLREKDQLISLSDGRQTLNVSSAENLPLITKQFANQTVNLQIKRDQKILDLSVKLRSVEEVENSKKESNPKGYLGVIPSEFILQQSTWSAPIVGLGLTVQITKLTFQGLGSAIANVFRGQGTKAGAQVAGPVGVFVLLKDGSELGAQFILLIVAVISLSLAIMNVLPIPALDGGRLFVTMLFRIAKKPLHKRTENTIHGLGFLFLMVLFVLITVVDVKRNF